MAIHIDGEFGIYTDVKPTDETEKYNHRLYTATCSICGTEVKHKLIYLKRKNKKCRHHVRPIGIKNPRIKKIFQEMRSRCENPSEKSYKWYGAKGIKVCDEWIDSPSEFERWAINSGYKNDLTIDRMDETKGYSPDNCRWVTSEDNAKYKSTTTLLDIDGETHTGRDWALICGLGIMKINEYLRNYSEEQVKDFIRYCRLYGLPHAKHKQSYISAYLELTGHRSLSAVTLDDAIITYKTENKNSAGTAIPAEQLSTLAATIADG